MWRRSVGFSDEARNSGYSRLNGLAGVVPERRMNDSSVLIVEIPPSPKKPYFMKSEGLPSGVYVRVGSSTNRATSEHLEDLVREGKRINFEE